MAITKVKINGNWELASPTSGGAVSSVNGQTGTVVLDATDVGALPDNTSIPSNTSDLNNDSGFITSSDIPVTSVNSKTGAVSLSASDVGALPSSTTIPQGTITSVRVQATSPVSSSTSTEQTTSLNTTISLANAYGDTKNPYGTKTANYVLAAPNGSSGNPSFRALVKADLPSLSASDVGALPSSTTIPSKVSQLQNDSGYITGYTETDPTVPSWAKASSKPTYTASEVGALPDNYTPPVTSVNTQTGDVELDAEDVGALPVEAGITNPLKGDLYFDFGYVQRGGHPHYIGSSEKAINSVLATSSQTVISKMSALDPNSTYIVTAYFSATFSTTANGISDVYIRKKDSGGTYTPVSKSDFIATVTSERKVSLSAIVSGAVEIDLFVWMSAAYTATIKSYDMHAVGIS